MRSRIDRTISCAWAEADLGDLGQVFVSLPGEGRLEALGRLFDLLDQAQAFAPEPVRFLNNGAQRGGDQPSVRRFAGQFCAQGSIPLESLVQDLLRKARVTAILGNPGLTDEGLGFAPLVTARCQGFLDDLQHQAMGEIGFSFEDRFVNPREPEAVTVRRFSFGVVKPVDRLPTKLGADLGMIEEETHGRAGGRDQSGRGQIPIGRVLNQPEVDLDAERLGPFPFLDRGVGEARPSHLQGEEFGETGRFVGQLRIGQRVKSPDGMDGHPPHGCRW